MPACKIIQDSDDDESGHTSPEKVVRPTKPAPRVDVSSADLGNSLLAEAATGEQSSGGTGSTEHLSQAIRTAHRNLLEPSPDALLSELQQSWSGGMVASPTISKVKRRMTTMEAFSSNIVGAETTKMLKTYGRKGPSDSSGLTREGIEELDLSDPRKARKRRAGSGNGDMLGLPEPSDKKKLKRRATTHLESPTSGLGAAHMDFVNDFNVPNHKVSHHQISSTVLNTSLEPPKSSERDIADQNSSSGRMTTPTISTRSPDGTAIPLLDPDEEDPLAAPVSASSTQQVRPFMAFERKTNLEVVIDARITTRNNTAENYEVILPIYQPPSSPPLKSKSKRKLSQSFHLDDFGSDDAGVGLPAEQYQPRPSRSRANRTVDDFVMNIDYARRPEAIAKKAKRRKTTGFIVDKEEVVEEIIGDFKARSKAEEEITRQAVEEHVYSPAITNSPSVLDQALNVPTLSQEEEPLPKDVNPPKKKRGRPKKQAAKKEVDTAISVDLDVDGKTAEEMILEEDEPDKPAVPQLICQQVDALVPDLEENDDAANVVKEPPVDDIQHSMKECTPAPANPAAAVRTPQGKAATVGPKRSPLTSNKVPLRVGLSKRASIQPLLRMVRK